MQAIHSGLTTTAVVGGCAQSSSDPAQSGSQLAGELLVQVQAIPLDRRVPVAIRTFAETGAIPEDASARAMVATWCLENRLPQVFKQLLPMDSLCVSQAALDTFAQCVDELKDLRALALHGHSFDGQAACLLADALS